MVFDWYPPIRVAIEPGSRFGPCSSKRDADTPSVAWIGVGTLNRKAQSGRKSTAKVLTRDTLAILRVGFPT